MGNKLEGKITVITGGASGIGLATTKRFVLEGAYVFIIDRHKKELDLALSEIGKNVVGIEGDISNLADLDKLYNIVKDQKGHIDILFANAGIIQFSRLGKITEEHFDKLFSINVKGLLYCTKSTSNFSG
jgi:NAD(P)-dependent dehydrogenase (short-subunit alcohol dehydrogenase family)